MAPSISVIIPNYNHAFFLPKRIDSVLNQTVETFEVIILDDCSKDNSREIIEEYKEQDNRIKVCYNQENSGSPFKQWQKGIEMAQGELIWIAESDDFADNSFLETLLKPLVTNNSAGVAYCQSHIVNSESLIVGNHIDNLNVLHPTLWQDDFCISGQEMLSKYMPVINTIPNISATVFRKKVVEEIDWDKIFKFKLAGDRAFWIEILKKWDVCFVNESLNYFRIHDSTVRSSNLNTISYLSEIKSILIELHKAVGLSSNTKTKAIRQWFRHFKSSAGKKKPIGKIAFCIRSFGIFLRLLAMYFYK